MLMEPLIALWHGFGIALTPHNLMWSFFGVLAGNLIGVLPGMGALSAISILLPLTYVLSPVAAILMIAGIYYGSMYGGVIGAVLLNLPSHPPHAVTCLEGYPMTLQGKAGTALGIAMMASFFAASCGITMMIFASPWLVSVAFKFGPAEFFSVMLLGLLCGGTMSSGSALKGIAMTAVGLLIGVVGTDIDTGVMRFTFGFPELADRVDLVALALGLFGIGDFLSNVNHMHMTGSAVRVRLRDMRPTKHEVKQSFFPMLRGTLTGLLFGAMPGTGPTITAFVAYALEKKISKTPNRFGHGALEGVASPEASCHAKTQVDFIPTMSLGIPGDAVMALILGALLIQGINPGPQMITQHPDVFWGLVASFWIGNILLVLFNVPLIGVWIRLLRMPYRYMYPSALFLIAVGAYSTNNNLFEVGEALLFGVMGAVFKALNLSVAPILLGYVLGPLIEENFRRALVISDGNLSVFIERPISATFLAICALLILAQMFFWLRRRSFRANTSASGSPVI
jgi:TctA family transporter